MSGADCNSQAALLLRKQLAELNKNPVEGFSAGLCDDNDIFKWEVREGSLDTITKEIHRQGWSEVDICTRSDNSLHILPNAFIYVGHFALSGFNHRSGRYTL